MGRYDLRGEGDQARPEGGHCLGCQVCRGSEVVAHYWGRFVPSVINGAPAGTWEHFRNAENPARVLKDRAREQVSRMHLPGVTDFHERNKLVAFNEADGSAMMLIWLAREQPPEDKAPDEVWHLTNRFGLIRTPWSVLLEDANGGEDDVDAPHEPVLTGKVAPDEESVIDLGETYAREVWQPPSLGELAERKVILVGDKRPLTAGAYSERQVERPNLRRACDECGVVPSPFTLECRC